MPAQDADQAAGRHSAVLRVVRQSQSTPPFSSITRDSTKTILGEETAHLFPPVVCQVKVDSMAKAYQPRRHSLRPQSTVAMAELLAAREDICNVVKTSSGSSREKTACAVNKVENNIFPFFPQNE